MFETFGFDGVTARQAAVALGLVLGLAFGVLAEVTRFCLRRAIVGDPNERGSAAGVWLAALAAAVIGTQAAVAAGLISFDAHRFMAPDLPWLAIITGGLLFGAGMVLTRGCPSRLTVLLGSGNLRSLTVLLVFAVTAHATLKGVLSPVRTALGTATAPLGDFVSLAALPGGPLLVSGLIAVVALVFALRSDAARRHLGLGFLLGLLVPAAWVGTGFILFDAFDPIPMESLSFTSPTAETLFWGVASTSIPAGFGVGLIGGAVGGALLSSTIGGRFRWQSFETPAQTGRYVAGGALMGVGGVLAGGCTLGAGLSGVPSLSFAPILAIVSIIAGGRMTDLLLRTERAQAAVPAE